MSKLIIFGTGRLGGAVLDALALRHPQHEYVLVGRDATAAAKRANLTRYVATQWGTNVDIASEEVDLLNTEATAELLSRHRPSVIFNATTPFPWWKISRLPAELALLANEAGPGVWAALDVLLPSALARGRELALDKSIFVNGCYPDMTNAYLSQRVGAPTLGIGNLANVVPGLKIAFAHRDAVLPTDISIRLVAHHNVSLNAPTYGSSRLVPYFLEVVNLTTGHVEQYSQDNDYPFELLRERAQRVRGPEGQAVTTTSAASLLAMLLNRESGHHHSPGALGHPGGYPIRIDSEGQAQLDLPTAISEFEAVQVNQLAQVADGIASVSPNQVIPTELALEALFEITALSPTTVTPDTQYDIAKACVESLNSRYSLELTL